MTDPQALAMEELEQVSAWADESCGELARCYGSLAEVFAEEPRGAAYQRTFDRLLAGLAEDDDPLDELRVVVDQTRQRGYFRAAWRAARVAAEAVPDSGWAQVVASHCARVVGDEVGAARHERLAAPLELDEEELADEDELWLQGAQAAADRGAHDDAERALDRALALASHEERLERRPIGVRVLAARDPAAGVRAALELHAELAQDRERLAEHHVGHAAVELALKLLLAVGDRRALAVQQTLVDAKLALWGECPSAWLERHNLGTVHAELGELAEARALIAPALAALEAQHGPEHGHVALARRSLARVDALLAGTAPTDEAWR